MVDSLLCQDIAILDRIEQYLHFIEGMPICGSATFDPARSYSSDLVARKFTPVVPRQQNGYDCGPHVLVYHQLVHEWYGQTAAVPNADDRVQLLLHRFDQATPARAAAHRLWLRQHMHQWTDRWLPF